MRRGILLLALLALTPALTFGQEAAPVQIPSFKSGIELVTVAATVRDKKGRLVKGLTAGDFEVFDNGQPRAITDFRDDVSPVSLAILFDISGSMRVADRMTAARFAAHHVLSFLEPGRDEAALLTFDSRLEEVAPFTVDTRALQGALGEVDPFGATSLHDAIADASKRVAARTGRRRAVVVITDGIDTSSGLSPSQVSGMASAIDVPVYVIATVLPIDHPGRDGFLPRGATKGAGAGVAQKDSGGAPAAIDYGTIEDLAAWTGGAFFFTSTPADTSQAAKQVLDELRQHYVLAFEQASIDGWRPLEIRTRGKDHVVRARSGYIAGAPVFH